LPNEITETERNCCSIIKCSFNSRSWWKAQRHYRLWW